MRFGVDFGTTRIVVAAADRGNYPLVPFDTPDGDFDWFPALIALRGNERRYGWDAWNAQNESGWVVVRSLKRLLEDAGPETRLAVCGNEVSIAELLEGLAGTLRQGLRARFGESASLEVMLGVPANANSNQRFLTVDAFRKAGFSVLGLLNEPSAASIEYGHRNRATGRVLIYDLGGGTFDVSLVELAGDAHTVLASEGDFDTGRR